MEEKIRILVSEETDNDNLAEEDSKDKRNTLLLEITTLENKTKELKNIKKLKEEIQKTEEFIKEEVRENIFSNKTVVYIVNAANQWKDILTNIIKKSDNTSSSLSEKDFDSLLNECTELRKECQKIDSGNQPLDQIKSKISENNQKLNELINQLLNVDELQATIQVSNVS